MGRATCSPMALRLFINNIPSLDRLIALEYGRVDDGHDPRFFDRLDENVWLYLDPETRDPIGFSLLDFSKADFHSPGAEALWSGHQFDAPTLGLGEASIAEIAVAVRAVHGSEPTLNRIYFERAAGLPGQEAIDCWRMCLECGDGMAHFGLGCALCEEGQYREAYQHLRHYVQIAPIIAWNWRWYGAAAEAIGEKAEARKAYLRAVELCEQYCQEETDAPERLAELGSA